MQQKRELALSSKHIRVILLVSVVLLSLLLIINAFRNRDSQNPNNPEISNEQLPWDFLPLEDISRIDFPGVKIQLPEGWSVTALLSSPKNTGYNCVGSTCRVAMLAPTLPETKLVEVIISTPTYVRVDNAPQLQKMNTVGIFAGETMDLTADRSFVNKIIQNEDGTTVEGDIVSDRIFQIYGCRTKDLCVYAGNLSEDLVKNIQQVEELKKLIRELVIL